MPSSALYKNSNSSSILTSGSHYGRKVLVYFYTTLGLYLSKFLLVPVLARNLGLEAYGIWSQISVAIEFLVPFCFLALPDSFIRFSADKKDSGEIARNYYTVLFSIMTVALGVSALFFTLSGLLSKEFIKSGGPVVRLVQVSSLFLFFSCLSQYAANYFRTFQRVRMFSFLQLFQAVGTVLFSLVLIHLGGTLFHVIIAFSLTQLFVFLLAQFFIQKEIGWKLPNLELLGPFFSFSLPLVPLSILGWVINVSDRYVIGFFFPITEVAKYSACYALSMVITLYYAPFLAFLWPKLIQLWESKDESTLRKVLYYSNKYPLVLCIPTVFGYGVLSDEILRMMTGKSIDISPWLVPSVCIGYMFFHIGGNYLQVFSLVKKTKYVTVGYIIAACVNVAVNIALVPLIGITGAALGTMVTFFAQMIYYVIRSRKFYDLQLKWDYLWKILLSSFVMFLSLILSRPFLLNFGDLGFVLVSIAVGGVIYLACILIMGVFKTDEIKLLKSLLLAG